jgi:tetratricopeptide (TPR) repeat protein
MFSCQIANSAGTEALLFYNKAIDYYKMGLYEDAISNFRKSIDADPEFTDAYFNLGSVYEFLQQYDEALSVFKQVIIQNPEDYEAAYHAAWLSYKVGEYDKAKTYLSLIPDNVERYGDAKNLYKLMGTSPEPKNKDNPPPKKQNGLYENIPSPTGITADEAGNIYVAQFGANSIIKITPDDKKILYIKNSKINGPIGIAFDGYHNLYIANYNADNVIKVSNGGAVSVLITNISKPYGLYIKNGILYVTMQGSSSVLKYKLK